MTHSTTSCWLQAKVSSSNIGITITVALAICLCVTTATLLFADTVGRQPIACHHSRPQSRQSSRPTFKCPPAPSTPTTPPGQNQCKGPFPQGPDGQRLGIPTSSSIPSIRCNRCLSGAARSISCGPSTTAAAPCATAKREDGLTAALKLTATCFAQHRGKWVCCTAATTADPSSTSTLALGLCNPTCHENKCLCNGTTATTTAATAPASPHAQAKQSDSLCWCSC